MKAISGKAQITKPARRCRKRVGSKPKLAMRKTLILALGNPILSDDAVGWEIADRLALCLPKQAFDIAKESGATPDLVPMLAGYERLVIIDAIQLGSAPVGTVHRLTLDDLNSTVRWSSAHDVNFATAFALAKTMGCHIPADVRIYAIEAKELLRFSESCTPEIQEKLCAITREIYEDLTRAE